MVKPKRKVKYPVSSEQLRTHFENLLGEDPPDICEEVMNLIGNDMNLYGVLIDSLYNEIS